MPNDDYLLKTAPPERIQQTPKARRTSGALLILAMCVAAWQSGVFSLVGGVSLAVAAGLVMRMLWEKSREEHDG